MISEEVGIVHDWERPDSAMDSAFRFLARRKLLAPAYVIKDSQQLGSNDSVSSCGPEDCNDPCAPVHPNNPVSMVSGNRGFVRSGFGAGCVGRMFSMSILARANQAAATCASRSRKLSFVLVRPLKRTR